MAEGSPLLWLSDHLVLTLLDWEQTKHCQNWFESNFWVFNGWHLEVCLNKGELILRSSGFRLLLIAIICLNSPLG